MISNILPTFTSLITLPMLSPSWPKCVAQVGCRPVRLSPICLSPNWFVAQMTVHHISIYWTSNTDACRCVSLADSHELRVRRLLCSETFYLEQLCTVIDVYGDPLRYRPIVLLISFLRLRCRYQVASSGSAFAVFTSLFHLLLSVARYSAGAASNPIPPDP